MLRRMLRSRSTLQGLQGAARRGAAVAVRRVSMATVCCDALIKLIRGHAFCLAACLDSGRVLWRG
jgi:hypothetical protein